MKEIIGYEGLYSITDTGNVFSHLKNKFLKPTIHKGYQAVRLYIDSIPRFHLVHRLLALHYIPKPEGKVTVNHKDGNKMNNNLSNLEWVTQSENTIHAWSTGLCSYTPSEKRRIETSKKCRKFNKEVEQAIIDLHLSGMRQKDLAESYSCSRQLIYRIVNNKHKV